MDRAEPSLWRSSGWLLGIKTGYEPWRSAYARTDCAPPRILQKIDGLPVFDTGATNLFTVVPPTLTVPDRWFFPRIEGG